MPVTTTHPGHPGIPPRDPTETVIPEATYRILDRAMASAVTAKEIRLVPTHATWLHAIITIGFGALAGGLTNAVAIWMLFHPHEPKGPWRLRIQGAIPKNRARLAKTIGRTVGERLLTPADLASQLASPGLRDAFARTVHQLVASLLERERGTLREELPPALVAEVEAIGNRLGPVLAERLAAFAATEAFRTHVTDFLDRAAASVRERPLGDFLTEARRAAIRARVEQWVTDAVASDGLQHTIHDWLDRQLDRAAADRTPLLERLPPGLVGAVERAVAGYLPVALERVAAVLHDPDARERLETALHGLFRRFLKDLMLHERIVARLVVTEKTIARLLDNLGREGMEDIARTLEEPTMRAHIARAVNEAVVSFLRRPLADHLTSLGQERIDALTDTAARYIVTVLRDPTTRSYVAERIDRALLKAEQRTWGDLLERLPREDAAAWTATALQSEQARAWVAEGWSGLFRALLDRPLGRPAERLGEGSVDRITAALAPPLWDWTQHHVPDVVAQLDIPGMVEQKVLGFSLDRMEQIVRMTTQRELDLIVRLGYLLGAIVGAVAFGVGLLLP